MKAHIGLITILIASILMFTGYWFGLQNRTYPEFDNSGIRGLGYSNSLDESFIRKDSIQVNNCWCYIYLIYEKDTQITLNIEKKWWRD